MKENGKTLKESFNDEIENISSESFLNNNFRKRKVFTWIIRTLILITLYLFFWKYDWVKKSLYFTIPLSLFSLFSIILMPYFIKRKIQRVKRKIEYLEKNLEN